jgi:hypothetical protein
MYNTVMRKDVAYLIEASVISGLLYYKKELKNIVSLDHIVVLRIRLVSLLPLHQLI